MQSQLVHALLTVLLLGCAAPAPHAAPQGAAPAEDGPGVLRFGDPDAPLDFDFFGDHDYDPEVPLPAGVLGVPVGSRPAHPHEILEVFRGWESSPRVSIAPYARSFEGRELVRVVITSPANQERLADIQRALAALADPRELTDAEAEELVASTPACAWLGYSIHGDEISGADASMIVGYHLVAGRGPAVTELLDDLVVVIDPVMNPDGRERFVSQLVQTSGFVPNMDYASMQRGRWPEGRGNHYLFDMNRDWIAGTAPETRGRWRAVRELHPQVFVDAHEMGALDTYLFYPQSRAHNPHLPTTLDRWHGVFGDDQAAAFDAHGWGYYTREWADGWGPFYSDAWASLNGAIGILYEMAGTSGQPLRRESGEVVTYRGSVHRHATSSLANLSTLHANREEILRDYLAGKRANLEVEDRWFACRVGRNADREDELVSILLGQGIEVFRASESCAASNAVDTLGAEHAEVELAPGTLLVPARQPLAPLVLNYLGFDIRMNAEDLLSEREELERKGQSNIYDVTAWGLPHALDLDALWCDVESPGGIERIEAAPVRSGRVIPTPDDARATAWAVDGADDAAPRFAAQAMELDVRVHLSDEPFSAAGRRFPRGSLIVRRHENDDTRLDERIAEAARLARATVHAASTGRSPDDGPDLGGGHFALLTRPRIAVLANSPTRRDTFGHLWYTLDHELRVPYSLLDATSFGRYDLRRYNVLVLPPAGSSLRVILEEEAEGLAAWVRGGGTLVACGSSAAMLTDEDLGLSSVRLRRDVLEELEEYARVVERERAARSIEIDEQEVWGDVSVPSEGAEDDAAAREVSDEHDAWLRLFSPRGAFARGEVRPYEWITSGVSSAELPVPVFGSNAFLAKPPVSTAVRFARANELRLSGLLWPEARERIGDSTYLTVERRGAGQVILFASTPGFRGYFRATARLLANAVIYGPGAGASSPVGW